MTQTLKVSLGDAVLMLYPPIGDGGENERGLAVLCYSENFRALITGDMDGSSERMLLRFAYLPEVELLVVGHHGSRHSTSNELLYAIRPGLAVISVGNNTFGHPAEATLYRLERHGVTVMRTDIMGSITVTGGADG